MKFKKKEKAGLLGVPWLPFRSWLTPILKMLYALIVSPMIVYVGERIIRGNDLQLWLRTDNGDFAFWMTTVAVFIVICTFSLITTKMSLGVGIVGAVSVVAHSVHYFKLEMRGDPFFPWDIFQMKEAADIVSDVKIEFTDDLWSGIFYVVAFIIGAVLIDIFFRYPKIAKYPFRLAAGVLTGVALCFFTTGVIWNAPLMAEHGITLVTWDEAGSYDKGGFFVTFMQNAENMIVEEPAGYTEDAVTSIADGFSGTDGKKPNVICIMSEAFADPDQWTKLKFDRDITPVLDSLKEDSLTGMVLTPSYGGGTSISEYEVLTGNCASYLPQGTVPYMQYVNEKTDSYASFLKELGYSTVAIHPYKPDFWSRDKAYPLMGFDKFISMDDFKNPTTYRWQKYISDMDMTEMIISEYESAKDDGPFFAFCVSMQNHASYAGSDYGDDSIRLVGDYPVLSDDVKGAVESFATGAHLADEALGALVEYFENEDSDTVIIFFGDHQPHVGAVELSDLGLTSLDNPAELNTKLNYSTPYVIWNNFDDDISAETADFSMYQLLPYATEKLGLARPAYFEYLSEVRGTLAGNTPTVALLPDGTPVPQMSEEMGKVSAGHWLVQYDMMFGSKYASLWSASADGQTSVESAEG